MRSSSAIIGLALLLSACASASGTSNRQNRDVMTQAQLLETGQTNAYDAVRSLQPRWLRPGMSVYIDGAPTIFSMRPAVAKRGGMKVWTTSATFRSRASGRCATSIPDWHRFVTEWGWGSS